MLKKIISVCLCIIVATSLVACGRNNIVKTGDSRTHNFIERIFADDTYLMEFKTFSSSEEETICVASKGEKYYMDVKGPDGKQTFILKDGMQYTISHDNEAYIQQESDEESDDSKIVFNPEDFLNREYKTGVEEIAGLEYYYEEFLEDEISTRYCFEKDGKDLKYIVNIKGDQKVYMQILSATTTVSDDLFEIPPNYELLNY